MLAGGLPLAHLKERRIESVYFSNDIDGTDSLYADATGTPEPAGLEPDTDPALPLAYHPRDIEAALRVAGFGARDTADYLSRLAAFANSADVDAARGVLARFETRATDYWHANRAELLTALFPKARPRF